MVLFVDLGRPRTLPDDLEARTKRIRKQARKRMRKKLKVKHPRVFDSSLDDERRVK